MPEYKPCPMETVMRVPIARSGRATRWPHPIFIHFGIGWRMCYFGKIFDPKNLAYRELLSGRACREVSCFYRQHIR